ncbi:11032_t:CDS:2, partial [Funneliformis caledonium]
MTAPSIIQWPENTTRSLICNVDIITDCESSRSHSALWTSISDGNFSLNSGSKTIKQKSKVTRIPDAYYDEGYMDRLGRDLHVDRRRTNTAKRRPPRS